jgi:hypothetical protein
MGGQSFKELGENFARIGSDVRKRQRRHERNLDPVVETPFSA